MTDPHFSVQRTGANSIRVVISGGLDAVAMETGLQAMTLEMEGMAHGDMLMIDAGAQWPSLGALAVELRHWPQMMAMMLQIDRAALVSHNPLFRAAARVESALIPGYEIRSFNDEASATQWLAEARAAP